jgi:hypothetical protein
MAMTFDIYSITKIIKEGLSSKLELVENSLNKLDANVEPISILENFVFFVNTNTSEFYRANYKIVESSVLFSNPIKFDIDNDAVKLDKAMKKTVSNIVEALADNDDDMVSKYKADYLGLSRDRYQLESKMKINVGTKSPYLRYTKDLIKESVDSTRNAKSLIKKSNKKSLFFQLLENKEIAINPEIISETKETKTRKRVLLTKIVEARNSAKDLVESPVFKEYAQQLFSKDEADITEAIEFIAESYQELYTLSLSEQAELFNSVLEKANTPQSIEDIASSLLKIGEYAMSQDDIHENLVNLTNIIGAQNGDFHNKIKLIEDEINSRVYTSKDIVALKSILEKIIQSPSEFLSMEFVVEAKKAYTRLTQMQENNNFDDGALAAMVNLVSQFYPSTIGESKQKGSDEEYEKFFNAKLEKYGVSSPGELSDEDKKKFFNEIDKDWTGEKKGKSDDVDEDDENAESTIYSESEACNNCGSPVCLCSGLKEAKEEKVDNIEDKEDGELEEAKEEEDMSYDDLKKAYKADMDMDSLNDLHKKVKSAMKNAKEDDLDMLEELEDEISMKKAKS